MKEIIQKLKNDITYSLSTRDFETLGFSFEDFLRYGQISMDRVIEFNKIIIKKYDNYSK
tara:strand:+ start:76 stop:252 length:177 start_codon:yes stop_codon:yes gene_type:complete